MNIEYLHYFLDVAHTKSITQAARLNFISPQGMSRAMNELEKELDCQLLVRYSNKLSLSPLGEKLVPQVTDILARYRKMLEFTANSTLGENENKEGLVLLCHNIAMLAFLPTTAVDFLVSSKELPFQEATNTVIRHLMTPKESDTSTPNNFVGLVCFFDNGRTSAEEGFQHLEKAGLKYRPYLKTFDEAMVSTQSPLAGKTALSEEDVVSRPLITTNSHLHSVLMRRYGQESISAASSDFSLRKRLVVADAAHSFLPAIYSLRHVEEEGFTLVPLEKTYDVEIGFIGSESAFGNPAFKKLQALLDEFYHTPENLASGLYTLYE